MENESLQNVKVGTNRITGEIEVSSDKFLVFSIPYSAGFTAYVDGKETKLVQANSMYMGVELKKGNTASYLLTARHILFQESY